MSGILEGMRVVEGSAFVAAPLGGMTLAQLGADVIRFDPIGGGWTVDVGPSPARGAACSGRVSTRASARSRSTSPRRPAGS